jgi:integrase
MLNKPELWLNWVERHHDQPLLISTRATHHKKALSSSELAMIVRKTSRKAGLNKKVSPHMLRSTAITYALDQGASHRGVQQMAGWTTPLMITRYDKRRNDPRFSAVHHLKYAQNKELNKELNEEKEKQDSNTNNTP